MTRAKLHRYLFLWVLTLAISSVGFAQDEAVGAISGTVEILRADGTREAVAGARVTVLRADIYYSGGPAITNAKGQFSFVGLQLRWTFILSVSAPGASPNYVSDLRAGRDKVLVTMTPGDGSTMPDAEVRRLASGGSKTLSPVAEVPGRREETRNGYSALSAQEVAQRSLPSVALIVCDDGVKSVIGSGFFIKPGVLVTNFHVIDGMVRGVIQVAVGSQKEKLTFRIARLIAFDKDADLALLSIPTADQIPTLPLVPVSYKISIGETVYAVGNPEGMVGTLSPGIVSSDIRSSQKKARIQITAPISHGSSGGPVVNGNGLVVGVAVGSISSGQNLNFAVPAALVHSLVSGARFPDDRQRLLDVSADGGRGTPKPWAGPILP